MQLLIIVLAIGLQIFLTYKKVSPFLSLLGVALLTGLAFGMHTDQLLAAVKQGVGSTLSEIALVICLGAILGKILERSGAARRIAHTLIAVFGKKRIPWAVMLTGFLVGIPLFYNTGFIILVPLVFSIARTAGLPLLYVAIPMAAGLSTTHCFLPPHPGPTFLVGSFHADLGKTLVYGLVIALPVVILAGPVLGTMLRSWNIALPDDKVPVNEEEMPGTTESFLLALMPVALIALSVVAGAQLPDSIFKTILKFTGDATVALLLAVVMAIIFLGLRKGRSMKQMMDWLNEGINGVAVVLLIITAGGVFKEVLVASGTGKLITAFASQWNMHPLLFAWLITAMLRVAIGSATLAGITAAGILSPLLASGTVSPELLTLAVGTGSVFGSHVNDSGFWIFKEFFNLSLKQTFLSWSVMETTISVLGLIGVMILQIFVK